MSLRMWLNGMCVIDERLYLFRIQSYILNRTRVENNVDEIHVSRAIEMADLSRHFNWEKTVKWTVDSSWSTGGTLLD